MKNKITAIVRGYPKYDGDFTNTIDFELFKMDDDPTERYYTSIITHSDEYPTDRKTLDTRWKSKNIQKIAEQYITEYYGENLKSIEYKN